MVLFILLYVILLFVRKSVRREGLFLVLLLFSLLIGFRGISVCIDTQSYLDIYDTIGRSGYSGYPEPLYGYLNLWCNRLGFGFHLFQWVVSLISMSLIGRVIIRHSPNYGYSVFVLYAMFFIFYSMNIVRQALAVSLVFYGCHHLYYHRHTKFILCVALAALCHSSAAIALCLLFVHKVQLRPMLVLCGTVGALLAGEVLLNDTLLISLAGPYAHYLIDAHFGFRQGSDTFMALILALFWSVLFLFIYFFTREQYRNNFWYKIYFVAVLLNNLCARMELGIRLVLFFSISEVIVFPLFIYGSRLKTKGSRYFLVNTFLTIFFFTFLLTGSVGMLPYHNVLWSGE